MTVAEYQWIANFGFAAVVAIYALVRLEKAMQMVSKQVRLNSLLLAKITKIDFDKLEREFEVVNDCGLN